MESIDGNIPTQEGRTPQEILDDTLIEMLKENTGSNLIDSGMENGRMWQRNQNVDFKNQPNGRYYLFKNNDESIEINVIGNLFPYLSMKLESYDSEMTELLWIVMNYSECSVEDALEHVLTLSTTLYDAMDATDHEHKDSIYAKCIPYIHDNKITGIDYSDPNPIRDYTYNEETMLSQDFQWSYFNIGQTPHICIEIHGGCDARWGFTMPRIFRCQSHDQLGVILDTRRIELISDRPDDSKVPGAHLYSVWTSDDAGRTFEVQDLGHLFEGEQHDEPEHRFLNDYPATFDPAERGMRKVYYDMENNKAYCPLTGGELVVSHLET